MSYWHTRLADGDRLPDCFTAINKAFQNVRNHDEAALFGFANKAVFTRPAKLRGGQTGETDPLGTNLAVSLTAGFCCARRCVQARAFAATGRRTQIRSRPFLKR